MPGPEPPRPADAAGRSLFGWPPRVIRGRETAWRLVVSTVGSSMRHRVTGLAAEAAFFTVLSVPPLIFALAGAIGYLTQSFSPDQVDQVRSAILDLASRFLTEGAVDRVIQPPIDHVLRGGRFGVISVGFVLALWSGSRAMHVFVDTITIMHGLSGHRGIVKTRAMSFSLYLLAIVTGVLVLPLVVAGPRLIHRWLPNRADFLVSFYWPAVLIGSLFFLATLYHVSIPVRTRWRMNLRGAALALGVWLLGSFLLREFLTVTAADSRSIYGPLAAPIAVLLWLYILSLAVLVGAALNASFDTVFAEERTARARSRGPGDSVD